MYFSKGQLLPQYVTLHNIIIPALLSLSLFPSLSLTLNVHFPYCLSTAEVGILWLEGEIKSCDKKTFFIVDMSIKRDPIEVLVALWRNNLNGLFNERIFWMPGLPFGFFSNSQINKIWSFLETYDEQICPMFDQAEAWTIYESSVSPNFRLA